jgi:hypothetical protein
MNYTLCYSHYAILEHTDGSPPFLFFGEESRVGSIDKRLPDFATKTKEELIYWLEHVEGFKTYIYLELLDGKGKYSACHVKVVDAWIDEYPDWTGEIPPPFDESKHSFGTR